MGHRGHYENANERQEPAYREPGPVLAKDTFSGGHYLTAHPQALRWVRELDGKYTQRTVKVIQGLSGYWSQGTEGTPYFHRTVPFEV